MIINKFQRSFLFLLESLNLLLFHFFAFLQYWQWIRSQRLLIKQIYLFAVLKIQLFVMCFENYMVSPGYLRRKWFHYVSRWSRHPLDSPIFLTMMPAHSRRIKHYSLARLHNFKSQLIRCFIFLCMLIFNNLMMSLCVLICSNHSICVDSLFKVRHKFPSFLQVLSIFD
jgi:hypothetical protein